MGVPKTIRIKDGNNGMREYYYWEEYDSWDEAVHYGKKIKTERKKEMRIRYFILASEDGWFLPVPKFVLYLNKKLRIN